MPQDNAMSQESKKRWFRRTLWSAGALYLWSLIIMWMGPMMGMSGWTFYALGVFPAVVGVFALSIALGLYMDLQK